jgi:hypothetical protein
LNLGIPYVSPKMDGGHGKHMMHSQTEIVDQAPICH